MRRAVVLFLVALAGCSGPGAHVGSGRAPAAGPTAGAAAHRTAVSVPIDEKILTETQREAFEYFYQGAHSSGLAYDSVSNSVSSGVSNNASNSVSNSKPGDAPQLAVGATGMGVMALIVGVERGFITRAAAAERVAAILSYLEHKARRYHGAWPHMLDPATGDGPGPEGNDSYRKGDIVETAYVAEGLLAAIQYFGDPASTTEGTIRRTADTLWREIEWDFYQVRPGGPFWWHWSSDSGFDCPAQTQVYGFNECMIVYLLAMASPTHPVSVDSWAAWAPEHYTTDLEYHGIRQYVQYSYGGGWGLNLSLFWTHYSYLGFDPRTIRGPELDKAGAPRGFTYFDVFRNVSLINRAYGLEHHPEHGAAWGLTASDDPEGYAGHSPGPFRDGMGDNGTITPTAALSAMPYTPQESYAALLAFRADPRLHGRYGFRDAYNPARGWYSDRHIGIDQGPIVIMIENHRSGLIWRLFMSHPAIADPQHGLLRKLADAGWTISRPQ